MCLNKPDATPIPVSMTFDDCNRSQYNKIYPILNEFEIKATFYIITNQISKPGKMTFEEMKYLHKEGNEIGSHTHTHPHLTNLSDHKLDTELKKSKSILKSFECKTLAYPFGEYNRKIIEYAQRYYIAARSYSDFTTRSTDFGYNHDLSQERYRLKAFPTEHIFPGRSLPLLEMDISELKKVLKATISNGIREKAWSIFVFHGPDYPPSKTSTISWQTNPTLKPITPVINFVKKMIHKKKWIRNFRWMCKFLANTDQVRVLTLSKAIEMFSDTALGK